MWLFIMFDLPVTTRVEARKAAKFRSYLLEEGFVMKQFSVYTRFYDSKNRAHASLARIQTKIPQNGMVSALFVTDKQFGQIQNFCGRNPQKNDEIPTQLALL
ncbi:MAG: CRISPR-associated endonuclease Cas2 [Alphaproteobacteria bacterium]|nr:CRISPR-associated endonuclease Cas2 [Alphaproteobacteria bacterium]